MGYTKPASKAWSIMDLKTRIDTEEGEEEISEEEKEAQEMVEKAIHVLDENLNKKRAVLATVRQTARRIAEQTTSLPE